ncbi:MAG: TonB-dependent receptor, partial [Pseudomonadota bacterium]|nr:TonB-dependent receptor [Pseudomonadota bacterium]
LYLKQHSRMDDVLVADNGDGRLENNNKPGPSFVDFGFSLANADLRYEIDDWGTVVYQFTQQWKPSRGNVDAGIKATGSLGIQTIASRFDLDTSGAVHELRLVSPEDGNWDWIVGLFSRDYEGHLNTSLDTVILEGVQRGKVDPLTAEETAIYGELTRRFGSHWEATLGLREYQTKIEGSFESRSVGVPVFDSDFSQSEDGLNPKFSLAYKASDSLMAYFTIARGFQFGGLNTPLIVPGLSEYQNPVTGTPVPLSFSSSVLWSREVGLRTDWLDRTLRFDVALFDIRWSKAQLSQNAGGATSNQYIDNVGEVSSRGVEGSLTWLTPLPGLSLNLLASYVRAVTTSDYVNGQDTVAKGAEMPASPPVQTSATLAYITYFGSWIAGASVSHSYWSRAYSDLQHTYEMYDFKTLDLSANVSRPDWFMRPTLTFGVTNLADERGVVGRNAAGALSGDTWTYNRPRALSLRLTAEFD